jgi:hypothetical protein
MDRILLTAEIDGNASDPSLAWCGLFEDGRRREVWLGA